MGVSIERSDRTLLRALTRRLRAGQARAGCKFSCQPGCVDCCLGVFPITGLDALRLQRGVAVLARRRPGRARAVFARASSSFRQISSVFPGAAAKGWLTGPDEERLLDELVELPCPALDLETRRCDLYPYRPISCRTFGPPVWIGSESLPPCSKCVAGLSRTRLERGRVDVDPHDREGELLGALVSEHPAEGETLVVFALVSSQQREVRADEVRGS